MPVSEEVIPIHLCKQTAAAFLGSVIREAVQECSHSTVLGYAGPFDSTCYDNVVISVHEISHFSIPQQLWTQDCCSKQAGGTTPTAPCSKAASKSPLWGGFKPAAAPLVHCLPKGNTGQQMETPCIPGDNILKDFGDILLKCKQNTFIFKTFQCLHAKSWPLFLSLPTRNSLAFTATVKD